MKRFRDKLRNNSGESFIELLCAILTGTLSAGILFSGIMISSRINQRAEESDMGYYQDLSDAEIKNKPIGDTIEISIKENAAGSAERKIAVNVYGNNDLYSYQKIRVNTPESSGTP